MHLKNHLKSKIAQLISLCCLFHVKAGRFTPGESPGFYEAKNKKGAKKLDDGLKRRSGLFI